MKTKITLLLLLCVNVMMAQEAVTKPDNRSISVSPELASAKDNQPVKKETFAAKMQRIKGDGNKIGLLLKVKPVRVPEGAMVTTMTFSQTVPLEGEYMDESLQVAGAQLTQELNEALATTDIELIDIAKIPYREVNIMGLSGKIDDWWATKYKIVFTYIIDPQLKATKDATGTPTYSASLMLANALIVTEYIGPANATKQETIGQNQAFGGFLSPTYTQDDEIKDVKMVYEKIISTLGVSMADKLKAERADAVKKFVAKKLTP